MRWTSMFNWNTFIIYITSLVKSNKHVQFWFFFANEKVFVFVFKKKEIYFLTHLSIEFKIATKPPTYFDHKCKYSKNNIKKNLIG